MKLKKFFAGVLAAAMMLTVGATAAFAETGADEVATANLNSFENGKTKFDATTPIYIYKEYQVKNGILRRRLLASILPMRVLCKMMLHTMRRVV